MTGEVWLAQGTDHAGSLRRPGTYCSVVGLRHSPGRITRGALNNLFAPLSVQGPMARCVADVALFLDTMAGWCPLDPLTYDAPAGSYAQAVAEAERHRPRSIAFTTGFNGQLPVDRETHEICAREMPGSRRWAAWWRRWRPTSASWSKPSSCCAASPSWWIASCSCRRCATS